MGGCNGDEVMRPVIDDFAVTMCCQHCVTLEPGTGGGGVTMRTVLPVWAQGLDDGATCSKCGSGTAIIGLYNQCRAQTVRSHALRIIADHLLNLDGCVSALGERQLKRVLAPCQGIAPRFRIHEFGFRVHDTFSEAYAAG